ncbi:MAG: glycoside hydrolase family protein [bacterium]
MNNKTLLISVVLVIGFLTINCTNTISQVPFKDRLQPVAKNSGFKMDGFFIWGGSIIKVNDTYHMFASRWPSKGNFPYDYFKLSEIVRATSPNPEGPYTFQEIVIGERDSIYWDSNMAHNPTIHKIGNKYVLFYNGSDFTTMRDSRYLLRQVGYAEADNIDGPWKRSSKPLINQESNNPAILVEPDESVKMIFRDEKLKVFIATASSYKGPYTIKNDNVWPQAKIEDFYLFKKDNKYHFICEDNVGHITGHIRWGAHLVSDNGIDDWKEHNNKVAYDHDIIYDDGTILECVRRERPQLFIENQAIKFLITGVFDGINSWCQPVPIEPVYEVDY